MATLLKKQKPLAWWLENVERCAEEYKYTADQQREYRLYVEHIAAWMRLYSVDQIENPFLWNQSAAICD